MNPETKSKTVKYVICLFLVTVTFAAFSYVSRCSFILLDDGYYVTNNPPVQNGVTWKAVKWAFETFTAGNWHPLTWISHMLDCQFFSLDPAGPHLVNLAIHIANTVLLFLLLQNLTGRLWPAAFVAMLFAIHPMHVESVAWVSERKDVLSAFFFLLTLLAYARYVELTREATTPRLWVVYGLTLFFFVLGLMAKPMLVTLPFVLLLLDYWPFQRIGPKRSGDRLFDASALSRPLVEKVPFFLLAAISCYVTYLAQKAGGAVEPEIDYTLSERLAHIPVSYGWYIFKLFWPTNLSLFYPLRIGAGSGLALAGTVWFLLPVTLFAVLCARRYPYLIFGWLWFLGMLVPVIGLVQVGDQAYADRYTYLPYIGLFIILAWGIPELLARMPFRPFILGTGFALVTILCFLQTVQEVHFWKNGLSLFGRSVAVDPKNETAWAILGSEYALRGNSDKAVECIKHALTLNRRFNLAWNYLGRILVRKGDFAGAEQAFKVSLETAGFKGDRIDLYNDLGDVLVVEGKDDEAIAAYQSSLEISLDQPKIQTKLAERLFQIGRYDDAAVVFENILRSNPDDAEANLCLGMIFQNKGRDSEAIPLYRKAIEEDARSYVALNNLSWLLATAPDPSLRNGAEAVSLAQSACKQTGYKDASILGTLAAAFAETGRFTDAVTTAQKAIQFTLQGNTDAVSSLQAQLMLYQRGQPYHDKPVASH